MGRMRKTKNVPVGSFKATYNEQSASLMLNIVLCIQGMVGITSQQAKGPLLTEANI